MIKRCKAKVFLAKCHLVHGTVVMRSRKSPIENRKSAAIVIVDCATHIRNNSLLAPAN
jgi:hypothetical protein